MKTIAATASIVAALAVLVACHSLLAIEPGPSTDADFFRVARRIQQLRTSGSGTNSAAMLSDPIKISSDDYLILGCDNSTAARNYPSIAKADREEGRWFAGGDDLEGRFGNSSGTIDSKTGRVMIDSFYTGVVRREYQSSPAEVAWHYLRVKELRAQGMPEIERIATMREEAKGKPWLAWKGQGSGRSESMVGAQ